MKTKQKNLHRHTHPVHWHTSMFVAIAALLITSVKTSSEMLRIMYTAPTHTIAADGSVVESVHLRHEETRHSHMILDTGTRVTTLSGA